jgi:putative heme-binding domain-containing protein
MNRGWPVAVVLLLATGAWWLIHPHDLGGQQPGGRANWIWFNEGDPAKEAPKETIYFRKSFKINQLLDLVEEGTLDVTADNEFTVWVNGAKVGSGKEWKHVQSFDVKKQLVNGNNVIAVEATNTDGPAGLLVRLGYVPNGQAKVALVSDGTWKASRTAGDGWQKGGFDDASWQAVKVLGPYGMQPWGDLIWQGGGDDRFAVPEGFRVELAVRPPDNDKKFSLVNMCFDAKGRLLVSREGKGTMLCTNPDKDGVMQTVKEYCTQVKNSQGMCWVKDALLLVGNGPEGTGLYRCRDTTGADKIDEVKVLHAYKGGMGEHGPHAVLYGPDGWLYVVNGNHSWAQIGPEVAKNGANPAKLAKNSPLTRWPTGGMGPDQGKKDTTEDVLLPRLNDGRGHAANILAPGGTIWRMDLDGKNVGLVAAGFRNHFDAAFAPNGELFTFDSDMEWDENLPWYRAVRVCHCPPGADFVWRTGAANTPDYYIDSLPPTSETGRGSPVGLEFYDHVAFPQKYRGCYFMADWSLGIIWACFLEREGASYKAKVERFCTGAPMNVTDLNVGPDGALYFVMGGRDSQGGVYRIVYKDAVAPTKDDSTVTSAFLHLAQPLSPWGRAELAAIVAKARVAPDPFLKIALDRKRPAIERTKAMDLLATQKWANHPPFLPVELVRDADSAVRAQAAAILGRHEVTLGYVTWEDHRRGEFLLTGLKDDDALVRRRSCEGLIRAEIEPPVDNLWPLLGDKDRFVRHAARLVLERIDPKKYADRIWKENQDLVAWNGIIALCQTNQAAPSAEQIFQRLRGEQLAKYVKGTDVQALLDWLRTSQLAMVHCVARPIWSKAIAKQCEDLFPHQDWRVNRELAILLVGFQLEGQLEQPVQGRLMHAILESQGDRLQQIHYVYCMRLLRDAWTPELAQAVTRWYEGTRDWKGGHSFVPFLENIYADCTAGFQVDDKRSVLIGAGRTPRSATVLAKRLQVHTEGALLPALLQLQKELKSSKASAGQAELVAAVNDAITQTAIANPTADTLHITIDGLSSKNPVLRYNALMGLRKSSLKPKAEEPGPFRAAILAAPTFSKDTEKWEAIVLLRQWTGRNFGAQDAKQWQKEYEQWALWFNQSFPQERPLKTSVALKAAPSKYKFDELVKYLDKERGDPVRGRVVFEKANCLKCHKFGKDGEGVGPDLTTVAKRFKRTDILDSIVYPSKVISDQYRSVKITTKSGQEITGLAAVQGDTVTVLLSDASKVTLRKDDIDTQVASLISVMPEQLLDSLDLREIADMFAFLESEPK